MEGIHVAILGCGLVIWEIWCEHASYGLYGLAPLDWQSRIVAGDVVNLVLRIQIVACTRELHVALRMVDRNMIVPHM